MVQNRPWTNRNKSPNMCVQSPTPNIDHNRDMMIFHQNHSGSAWSFTGWSGAPPVDVVTVTRNFVTVCNGTGNGFSTTITITQVLPLFQNMPHTFHITCHERHYYRDSKISVIACTPHQAIWHGASCFFLLGKIMKHVVASGRACPHNPTDIVGTKERSWNHKMVCQLGNFNRMFVLPDHRGAAHGCITASALPFFLQRVFPHFLIFREKFVPLNLPEGNVSNTHHLSFCFVAQCPRLCVEKFVWIRICACKNPCVQEFLCDFFSAGKASVCKLGCG